MSITKSNLTIKKDTKLLETEHFIYVDSIIISYNRSLVIFFFAGAFGSVFRGKYYPNQNNSKDFVDVAVKTIKSKCLCFGQNQHYTH